MNVNKIVRKSLKKTKMITIKITEDHFKWLKENNFSPTALFSEACKELGYKEVN